MKRFTSILLLCLLIFSFSSCRDDNDEEEKIADKTVIMFLPWAGDAVGNNGLLPYIKENIEAIKAAVIANRGLGNNRFMVFFCSDPKTLNFYEITYNQKTDECDENLIKKYDWPAQNSLNGIAELFRDAKVKSKSGKYALIIGGHGMGWIDKFYSSTSRSRFFGGTSTDYRINSADFAQAINDAGIHFQFILFDDCYMSNVEVAYDIRKCADYYISSTSEIMDYGLPYRNIWNTLVSDNPDYSLIVDEFYNFYKDYRYPYGAIGVTYLPAIDNLADVMKRINQRYDVEQLQKEKKFNRHVQFLDGFTDTYDDEKKHIFFDMGDYVRNLFEYDSSLSDYTQDPLYKEFTSSLSAAVPYCKSTDILASFLNKYTYKFYVSHFSGITCSDLTLYDEYFNAVELKKYTPWWNATH